MFAIFDVSPKEQLRGREIEHWFSAAVLHLSWKHESVMREGLRLHCRPSRLLSNLLPMISETFLELTEDHFYELCHMAVHNIPGLFCRQLKLFLPKA
jgi:hypothetical protein